MTDLARSMVRTASALALVAGVALAAPGALAQGAQKTLKFIPQADLRSIDPIWTTAYITRNHGYMVYDTLFAMDENFVPHPQMVDSYTVSPDKLKYTFVLRAGLKWHDGAPVRAADCVASLKRWEKRDPLGLKLAEFTASMDAVDDKTFTITLKEPFALVLDSLGKLSSNVPFMMPERIANTDAFQQISDAIGSGPFKFVKDEWVPGNKAVYVKNADYVPRKEKPSFASGAKVVKVDRVEWLYVPDATAASAALAANEVDFYEQPPVDLLPVLEKNKDIVVVNIDPQGSQGVLRFNFLHPPFNNVKARQALLYLIDQPDYLRAVAGDQKNWKVCYSMFACGTPLASDAGAEVFKGKRDVAKAKALLKEAGYNGEKVVILSATDQPLVHNQVLMTTELLRQAGVNVDLQANDWRSGGADAWFGWPDDPKIEKLRDAWLRAPDQAAQKKLAMEVQEEAYKFLPYIPTGQFILPSAYRKNLDGVIIAPVTFLWNIEKK
ncbi:MAG: ABC transporter substrate-binding protein [Proteobacteria bacterium]|nr:ABC transporter substrate-binding protein [Pseudomonadota bacterium]